MSYLLPSLRASTSRTPAAIVGTRAVLHVRHASGSTQQKSRPLSEKVAPGAQAADDQVAALKKQMASMKKNGRSMDLAGMATPVLGMFWRATLTNTRGDGRHLRPRRFAVRSNDVV